MPQLTQLPDVALSQFLWLLIGLAFIYFVVARSMVPKIQSTVDQRAGKITGDLEAAQRAREEADATEASYREQMDASRSEAMKLAAAAKQQGAMAAEERMKAVDSQIGGKVAEAEARIRSSVDQAMGEIEAVAAELARDLVGKLTGASVDEDQARKAVKAAIHG
jgi:F-type H+-transporting ATPase subunit b